MKVTLEDEKKLIKKAPIMFQFIENGIFCPAVIGVTNEGIVFYSDLEADEKNNNEYIYNIKKSIPYHYIRYAKLEKLHHGGKLDKYNRLTFIHKKKSIPSDVIFFFKREKRLLRPIFKVLRKHNIHLLRKRTNIAIIA